MGHCDGHIGGCFGDTWNRSYDGWGRKMLSSNRSPVPTPKKMLSTVKMYIYLFLRVIVTVP